MAIRHANPGQAIDLLPAGENFGTAVSTAIVKTENFEVIRLVIPKDHKVPPHKVAGPITVQCLSGSINFTAEGQTQELTSNQWLFLQGHQMHSLVGIQDAVVLVTMLFSR